MEINFCARWLIAKRCTLTLSIREDKNEMS